MRVQRKSYGSLAVGKIGTIVSHANNTLHIRLDDDTEGDDLYWNWEPLDEEAKKYLAVVEETATPLLSYFTD